MADDARDVKLRKLFSYASELHLTRAERMSFTRTLLWRDVESWKALDDDQIQRLLDAFEGFVLLNHLLTEKGMTRPGP